MSRHPAQLPAPLSPAFQLVRQLLAERPRTFQQILRDGIASTASSSETDTAGPSTQTLPVKGKSKSRKGTKRTILDDAENIVPSGHPFISANFLKRRVLPVLSSQNLITKSAKATPHTPSGTFTWSLTPSHSESSELQPKWDIDSHWDRLLSSSSSDPIGAIAASHKTYQTALKSFKREAAHDDPLNRAARRTEREMWTWSGRQEGITTDLERRHLNTRKAKGRPEKERRRAEVFGLMPKSRDVEQVPAELQGL